MKQRILALLLAVVMIFSLAACGGGNTSQAGETKTVTDSLGREVEIPADPQRVACLYASAGHMMAMLDQGDKIVGCPTGIKSDLLMVEKYPAIKDVATPFQEGSINVEELMRIDSDLVIIRYTTAANAGETEKLDDLGIPYVVVDYRTLDELEYAILLMGEIFNNEEHAQAYVDFADETVGMVHEKLGDIPEEEWPEVYHSINEATRTDAVGDMCGDIMNLACVKSISIEKGVMTGGDKTFTTLEEIYKWDPDAFIANEFSVTDYIISDSKWRGLTAVKEGKVYTLPVGATRWGHPGSMETHMATLAIAVQFWPEKFSGFDLAEYTKDYYKTYFGLDLDDQIIQQILDGEGMRRVNSPV